MGADTAAQLTGASGRATPTWGSEALDAAGPGPASALVPATPGAPKIDATTAQKKAVVVRWTKPASDGGTPVTRYVVRVYSGGTLVKAVDAGATRTSVTVSGLKAGRAYTLRVVAKNAAGTGAVSAASKAARPR